MQSTIAATAIAIAALGCTAATAAAGPVRDTGSAARPDAATVVVADTCGPLAAFGASRTVHADGGTLVVRRATADCRNARPPHKRAIGENASYRRLVWVVDSTASTIRFVRATVDVAPTA